MRPHGRARVSTRSPQAFAICDRCGFLYNHASLRWQYDWRGASMQNTRQLVCQTCLDRPQEQQRALVVPADPMPVMNPRTQNYQSASADVRTTSGQNTIDPVTGIPVIGGAERETMPTALPVITEGFIVLENFVDSLVQENGAFIDVENASGSLPVATYMRVTQQTGEPPSGINVAPGTDPDAPGDDNPGLPYNNVLVPRTGPL